MRAPLSWLRDFTPVEGPPEEIARALSFLGLVVESTEVVGPPLPGIVAARVLATRPHPAADRIQLVDVDVGDGEALQICCGAFNMKEGDLVPLATIGTVMPSGLEISRRKLRGEWSNGMLCSAPELGIGPEGPTPAIFLLPPGSASPGQPVAEALDLGADIVFDLEISPNRSDCFSIAGIARDLAAGMRLPFSLPAPPHAVSSGVEQANIRVDQDATALCRRFTGTVIEAVQTAAVAPVVVRRLTLAGMRPVSPVVDVSNYVMLELGQPNHPYDLDRLAGRGLAVRRGGEGEEIVTLDGVTRRLTLDDCVIADGEGEAVGIGGIMGGATAEISPETTTVLLEAANFDPQAVSATGKRLGLLSEARTRFERGVDLEVAGAAIDRFVELLGPSVRRGETSDVRITPARPVVITLRTERANAVLGTALPPEQCAELLSPLGFEPVATAGARYEVKVPTWRPDCDREIDLIEEIARIYGYDNIARSLPPRSMAAVGLSDYQKGRRRVRDVLAGAGASEAWTNTFLSEADFAQSGLDASAALELENPLDRSQNLLRTSLLPGLLKAARFNTERQAQAFSLFEVGSVFRRPIPGHPEGLIPGVMEWEELGLVAVGEGGDGAYAAKMWEILATGLRLEGATVGRLGGGDVPGGGVPVTARSLYPVRRAAAVAAGRNVGVIGELSPEIAAHYDLSGRVAVILIDLASLLDAPRRSWEARAVSRYPAVDLDMAFLAGDDVPASDLDATVREVAGDLAESVALFDVWRDPSLGDGKRSLAFRVRLRAPDRTLTEQEVAAVRDNVAVEALGRHQAVLRVS
ncbi:MAG TPA: phenylalanine--tRNA ligase subunit beta [Acidimicrobiales bacterium]|nr:phenylalanine--tRNA ligase subunit beta [Acidimicrobiales bacterium]